jgi:hypothetical protein
VRVRFKLYRSYPGGRIFLKFKLISSAASAPGINWYFLKKIRKHPATCRSVEQWVAFAIFTRQTDAQVKAVGIYQLCSMREDDFFSN